MLTMFVSRLWILSHSTWNPTSSFTASYFGLAFCHWTKILKDHFVTYHVDFGTDFSKNSFSSSPVFDSLNFLLGGIFNQPSSTLDYEEWRPKEKSMFLKLSYCFMKSTCWFCMLISSAQKRNCLNSERTCFWTNVFEAVQKTRSTRTCIIRCKNSRLRLEFLNLIIHYCSFFKHRKMV